MSINTIIKNLHTKVYNDIYNTEVFIFDKNLKLIELKEYLKQIYDDIVNDIKLV